MKKESTAKIHAGHAFSQFELTKTVLHNLKHFKLKPQTKTVLWVLVDCYNPTNGSVVFPSMEYIAEIGAMGLTSAKEGIKELINKGLIIKSKRGKIRGNYNKYLLTPKVQNPTAQQSENELFKQSETDCFMKGTKKEEQKKNKQQNVVVSFKTISSHQTVTLEDVPDIIKDNKSIKNPCSYWASLSENAKNEYLERKRTEKNKKNAVLEKIRKEQEEAQKKQLEEEEHIKECQKPLSEQYTYETACEFIKRLAKFDKRLVTKGLAKELAGIFNINVELL